MKWHETTLLVGVSLGWVISCIIGGLRFDSQDQKIRQLQETPQIQYVYNPEGFGVKDLLTVYYNAEKEVDSISIRCNRSNYENMIYRSNKTVLYRTSTEDCTVHSLAEIEGWVEDWQIKDIRNNVFESNYYGTCENRWTSKVMLWIDKDSSEVMSHKIHISIWEKKRGKK